MNDDTDLLLCVPCTNPGLSTVTNMHAEWEVVAGVLDRRLESAR